MSNHPAYFDSYKSLVSYLSDNIDDIDCIEFVFSGESLYKLIITCCSSPVIQIEAPNYSIPIEDGYLFLLFLLKNFEPLIVADNSIIMANSTLSSEMD